MTIFRDEQSLKAKRGITFIVEGIIISLRLLIEANTAGPSLVSLTALLLLPCISTHSILEQSLKAKAPISVKFDGIVNVPVNPVSLYSDKDGSTFVLASVGRRIVLTFSHKFRYAKPFTCPVYLSVPSTLGILKALTSQLYIKLPSSSVPVFVREGFSVTKASPETKVGKLALVKSIVSGLI